MPDDREPSPSEDDASPALLGDRSNDVGFLDLPGLGVGVVADAVGSAFATLAPGAILAVYSDQLSTLEVQGLCQRGGIELLAIIHHPAGGATFTLSALEPSVQEDPRA